MIIPLQDNKPVIPAGNHTLTLVGVEQRMVNDKYSGQDKPKIKWTFQSDQTDLATGAPYLYEEWTFLSTNEGSNLIKLLRQLEPDLAASKLPQINTDTLIGKRYSAKIQHQINSDGKTYANRVYIEPLQDQGNVPPVQGQNIPAPAQQIEGYDPFR